jgi:hypothetical protein
VRAAAKFEGRRAERVVSPEQIRSEPDLPDGYELLGRASATCTLTQGARQLDREWLSDVDCSERRLERALEERASEVGGELLVGLVCRSHPNRSQDEIRVFCHADVARAGDELRERTPLVAQRRAAAAGPSVLPGYDRKGVERLDEPVASEAWRIRVSFVPAASAQRRPARRAEDVRELAELPVNLIALGDLSTRCEAGCSRDSARNGLRLAAARMGARAVVDVRCASREKGWMCVGTAADYAVDPDRDPRAR